MLNAFFRMIRAIIALCWSLLTLCFSLVKTLFKVISATLHIWKNNKEIRRMEVKIKLLDAEETNTAASTERGGTLK